MQALVEMALSAVSDQLVAEIADPDEPKGLGSMIAFTRLQKELGFRLAPTRDGAQIQRIDAEGNVLSVAPADPRFLQMQNLLFEFLDELTETYMDANRKILSIDQERKKLVKGANELFADLGAEHKRAIDQMAQLRYEDGRRDGWEAGQRAILENRGSGLFGRRRIKTVTPDAAVL